MVQTVSNYLQPKAVFPQQHKSCHHCNSSCKPPAFHPVKTLSAANSPFLFWTALKIITYQFPSVAKQPFLHVLPVIGVENWGMGWKLEPSRMLSWKRRKSKLNEIMHAKRMFNQRAKRKQEITEKRKPLNVVLLQSVWSRACLCVTLWRRGGVACQYTLNCHPARLWTYLTCSV